MIRIKYQAMLLIIFLITVLSGCSIQTEGTNDAQQKLEGYDLSIIGTNLSLSDQEFLQTLRSSIQAVDLLLAEYELTMEEAEQLDELHEALVVTEQLKGDILFFWNQMHNGQSPDHVELLKVKNHYEQILMNMRRAISMELEGMETGDGMKMKEGWEASKMAKAEFSQFTEQIKKIK